MKKIAYIFFALWLFAVVLSNTFKLYKSLCDSMLIELMEKEANENTTDDDTDEKEKEEKKSEEKNEKTVESEDNEKFFEHRNFNADDLCAYYLSKSKNISEHTHDTYICTHFIELDSPPPQA
jgi:uncharacterized membrane protein YheB (UPF0754 family)